MNQLDELENKSIFLIREAYKKVGKKNIASLWSMGKDSTTLLWLIKKAFLGDVPFPIIHIDTTFKFPEMYEYRDYMAKVWGLDLQIFKNQVALDAKMNKEKGMFNCCNSLKTEALRQGIKSLESKGIFLAIRRDEHGIRAKERYFSPRKQDFSWDYKNQPLEMWDQYVTTSTENEHLRIHPLLDWTEIDVWRFIEKEKIPIIPMYFSRNGTRYRSLGCAPCTQPISSSANTISAIISELEKTSEPERAGRSQDKEEQHIMQKLRSLGYM